jgi:ElaB/YqjD/DUF883 family membrane-anchored ribosome-binding protein
MPRNTVETITLEPITAIISFDAISHRTYITVSGAIGHYKYPTEQDYNKNKSAFYKSAIGRRNKQKISEVISEIYAYLNTRISAHADTSDYYFRISLKLEVNKETAEIVGSPSFDVDVFRHIGKIGGKHSKIGKYVMQVFIVDKEKMALSPIFKKGVNKVKGEAGGLIDFTIYESYLQAPSEIKERISKDSYYILIDEEEFKIEPAIDPKTQDILYKTKDNDKVIEFRSEEDVEQYILKKLKISPKIVSAETGLTISVDNEIREISKELETTENEQKTDIIAQLGIEQILTELFSKLEKFKARAKSEKWKRKEKFRENLEEKQKQFTHLKVEYDVQESELARCKEEYEKQESSEDSYHARRVRTLIAIGLIESDLIKLQKELKEKDVKEVDTFVNAREAK